MKKVKIRNKAPQKVVDEYEKVLKSELRRINARIKRAVDKNLSLAESSRMIDSIINASPINSELNNISRSVFSKVWSDAIDKKVKIVAPDRENTTSFVMKIWVEKNESDNKEMLATYAQNTRKAVKKLYLDEATKETTFKALAENHQRAKNHAKFTASNEINTLNGAITALRDLQIDAEEAIWRTQEDDRVRGNPNGKYPEIRPSHFALNGKRFDPKVGILVPEGYYIKPGEEYGCRCFSDTVVKVEDDK